MEESRQSSLVRSRVVPKKTKNDDENDIDLDFENELDLDVENALDQI